MGENGLSRRHWLQLLGFIAWLAMFVLRPQLVFSLTLLLIGGAFIAYNAVIFWRTVVRKEEASSVAPIFGGVIAAGGVILLPPEASWQWAWLPLLLDWGGLPMFLYGGWQALRRRRR